MPSGLESIWTYVDPSTMQGVAAGVVLAVIAVLVLASYSFLGRSGLLAEGESSLDRLCQEAGFQRKSGWLRPRIVATGTVHDRAVTLVLKFRGGRAHWRATWKHGGGAYSRLLEVAELDSSLMEWLDTEVGRAIQ